MQPVQLCPSRMNCSKYSYNLGSQGSFLQKGHFRRCTEVISKLDHKTITLCIAPKKVQRDEKEMQNHNMYANKQMHTSINLILNVHQQLLYSDLIYQSFSSHPYYLYILISIQLAVIPVKKLQYFAQFYHLIIGYRNIIQAKHYLIKYGICIQGLEQWNIQLTLQQQMEKISWKSVRQNDRNGNIPSLRWGHSCCVIEDQVVIFGGYADSNYMNDVWSFNTITMEWRKIYTTGDIPSQRSNCSMSYDKVNHRIILFGGGGANKKRFNTVNILDWASKEWMEITPKPNESAPWERTYHTSQLFYPYLVVYGGEGISDLDDLWVFNFNTLSWTQIQIEKKSVRPCARRFHSSVKIGNQFYVVAGCYGKYRCLSDIYSIDLTKFFETGERKGLSWKQRKMKDNTFLTRWGHTSCVYQDKIYVYGGRFCNDLSDILVLDPEKNQINTLKIQGEPPKARRRHSACFLGSSLLIFGGFNGEYFNDLHYINIYSSKKKIIDSPILDIQQIQKLQNVKDIDYTQVKTSDQKTLKVYPSLLIDRFQFKSSMNQFLKDLQNSQTYSNIQQLMVILYRGYGSIDSQLVSKYQITLFETRQQKEYDDRRLITLQQIGILSKRRIRTVDPVIFLQDDVYEQFWYNQRNQGSQNDIFFNVNNQKFLRTNRAKIALKSPYFYHLLSQSYAQQADKIVFMPISGSIIFQTLVVYLTNGFVVVHKNVDHVFWVKLAELAEYFSLNHLLSICQANLIQNVSDGCCQELLIIALNLNLTQLSMACGEKIIKNMVNQDLQDYSQVFPQIKCEILGFKREKVLKDVYSLLRFDILQKKIDVQYNQAKNSSKTIDSEGGEQKQNFQNIS